MAYASTLFNQFAQSAPIIGAEKPRGQPEQGLYRLREAMQEHFAEVLKAVLHRAYAIDTCSDKPEVSIRAGHPHHRDLFVDILPQAGLLERLTPFQRDMNHLKQRQECAIDLGMDSERGIVLRFHAEDMNEALSIMIEHYEIDADERIARHMHALNHLIERTGGDSGYRPAHELH